MRPEAYLYLFNSGSQIPNLELLLFAALVWTPIVGLAYNLKFYGFFELLRLRERVLNVGVFVREGRAAALTQLIDAAMADREGVLDRVTALTEQIRAFNRSLLEHAAWAEMLDRATLPGGKFRVVECRVNCSGI